MAVALVTAAQCSAQQYNFKNYSVAEGLPQSQVYSLCEDKQGYLWMGTRGSGLSRFDGIQFTTFTEEDGLPSNYIRCVYSFEYGSVLVGTDNGLAVYDGKPFRPYNNKIDFSDVGINALLETAYNELWVGTEGKGVYIVRADSIIHLDKNNGLADDIVYDLYRDKQGRIWIGTMGGLSMYCQGEIKNYTIKQGLSANVIRSIAEDDEGKLWLATYGGGLNYYDGNTFKAITVKEGLSNNTLFCVHNDGKGNIWTGSAIGANRISLSDGKVTVYTDKEGLCGNVVMSIMHDRTGNVWLGSSGGGVSRYDSDRFIHFNDKNTKISASVYSILQDKEKNIWLASSTGGVMVYDGFTYKTYDEKQGFTASKVKSMYQSSTGHIWLGTVGDGLYKYDGKTFQHYGKRQGLCSNFVNAITEDEQHHLWVATSAGGLCCYDLKENKWLKLKYPDAINGSRVQCVVYYNGYVWVGLQNGGAYRLMQEGDAIKAEQLNLFDKSEKATVRSVVIYNKQVVMGVAGKGLFFYSKDKVTALTKENGLSSNNIYALLVDNKNQLWVGSEKGVDRVMLNEQNQITQIKNYSKNDGFIGVEVSQNGFYMDSANYLWLGTVNGVTRYDATYDTPNKTPPCLDITNIRLGFTPLEQTPYAITEFKCFAPPETLKLPYDQNNLSFDFIGISLDNPEGVFYQWKLEGDGKDWSPKTKQRTAIYSNLSPGDYQFKVIAFNADGVVSEERIFSFIITAPFWETYWFRTLVITTIIIVLYIMYKARIKKLKEKNRVEREKLELQKNVVELEQKALRLQMNPHFIFNALNSIQGYISKNETAEAKRHLARFSTLMRKILECSRESYIPLNEEIEILTNYLELEKLSTGSGFIYHFNIDEALDIHHIAIPPMLIQPFVENAVLHGIKQLQHGKIEIVFKKQESYILCQVIDNGIGIKQSIKETEHRSAGIEVTKERLMYIHNSKQQDVFNIIDLAEQGAKGTMVSMKIPFVDLRQ